MWMVGKLRPETRNASYERGIRLFDQARYEEAISEFGDVIRACSSPGDLNARLALFYSSEAHANLAAIHEECGNHAKAVEELEEAVKINPEYADIRYQLARACFLNEDPNVALLQLNIALGINPEYARARCLYGVVLYSLGRRDEGLAAVADAADTEPAFVTSGYEEAVAAHDAGDLDHALELLAVVAETKLDDISHHLARGREHMDKGLLEEAALEFQYVLDLNPNYADVRNNLGIVYGQMNEYEKAIEQFATALDINQDYVAARLNLAIAYDLTGDSKAAHEQFHEVLKRDPDNETAKREIEELAS